MLEDLYCICTPLRLFSDILPLCNLFRHHAILSVPSWRVGVDAEAAFFVFWIRRGHDESYLSDVRIICSRGSYERQPLYEAWPALRRWRGY